MKTCLVIMAAGLASRYGGGKQTAGMGPNGEMLMEYSVCDAIRAGFDRVIFVIRPEMLDFVKAQCGDRFAGRIDVRYAFQSYDSLPAWYRVPEGRVKPYGTVHAVLSAAEFVDGPFAVVNADDYYGVSAYGIMHGFLTARSGPGRAAMMGYRLENTVSRHGDVTRGICNVADGMLTTVEEVKQIHLRPDGAIEDLSGGEPGRRLDPRALVSMNFWGFAPEMMARFREKFGDFLRKADPGDLRAEYLLPVMVDQLVRGGELSVEVLETPDVWFGVTYREDRPLVQRALKELHERGVYGEKL